MLRSVLPIVMRRTAANTTSMAIDSRGIKNTETGGRSSRSRSAVTTASAITETNPWRDATAADIGPADCAEQKSQDIGGAIDRKHHLAHPCCPDG